MHNEEFTFNVWSNMKHKKVLKYSLCVCVCSSVAQKQCCLSSVKERQCELGVTSARGGDTCDVDERDSCLDDSYQVHTVEDSQGRGRQLSHDRWWTDPPSSPWSKHFCWPEAHSCFALLTETGRKFCFFFFCHNNIVKVAFASWILNLNHIRILTYLKKTAAKAFKLKSLMSKS